MKFFYIFLLTLVILPTFALAAGPFVPNCEPSSIPNGKNGANPCDLAQFTKLLQEIIKYLTMIVFPIAAVAIGWGGFMILTSGGSGERVASGHKAIKIAIIGVIILLASYLLITFVLDTLNINPETQPNNTDFPAASAH